MPVSIRRSFWQNTTHQQQLLWDWASEAFWCLLSTTPCTPPPPQLWTWAKIMLQCKGFSRYSYIILVFWVICLFFGNCCGFSPLERHSFRKYALILDHPTPQEPWTKEQFKRESGSLRCWLKLMVLSQNKLYFLKAPRWHLRSPGCHTQLPASGPCPAFLNHSHFYKPRCSDFQRS